LGAATEGEFIVSDDRVAIILHDAVPAQELIDIARKADEKGFWGVFMTEVEGHDAQVALGAVSIVTQSARLGSGISSIFTRSPTIYAMAANTLNALSGGRAILGIGTSPPFFVNHWHGMTFGMPLTRMRDYVMIVRQILDGGQKANYQGKAISVDDFIFSVDPPQNHIPIWVGALGPKMIEVGAEVADGVLVSPILTEAYLEFVVEHVKIGAEKGGKDWREVEIAAPIITTVDEDASRAVEWARSMVTWFSVVYYFEPVWSPSGHKDVWAAINRTNKDRGYDAARELVTEELARKFSVCGTPDECRKRLQDYRNAGLTLPVCNAPAPRRIFGQNTRVPVPSFELARAIVDHLP
jgi:5,10-methylenetetrahydromethanopterin reductase